MTNLYRPATTQALTAYSMPVSLAEYVQPYLTLNVEVAGAIGDGVIDDYNAINTALTYLSGLGGGTLIFPPVYKVYKIGSPITLPNNVTIKGGGDLTTYFKYTGSTQACFVTATNSYLGIRLEDFHIDLTSNTNAVAGIDCRRGLTRGFFRNVRVTTASTSTSGIIIRGENPDSPGAANQGQFNNIFENCMVTAGGSLHSGYGLSFLGANISDARVNVNTVIGGRYEGTLGSVYVNGQGNTFIGGNTEVSTVGIVFDGDQTYRNLVSGWYFDQPAVTTPIKFLSGATQGAVCSIHNCVGVGSNTNVTDQLGGGRQRYSLIVDDTIYNKYTYADNVPKAWVIFAGATGAITAQYNVSSVTRNAAGDYTVAFTNALASANIGISGATRYNTGGAYANLQIGIHNTAGSLATSSVRIDTIDSANVNQDANTVFVSFYCLNA